MTLSLRFYMSGIHCAVNDVTPWQMPMVVRTDSDAFRNTILKHSLPMRGSQVYWPVKDRKVCKVPNGLHGWHLSYFMNSSMMLIGRCHRSAIRARAQLELVRANCSSGPAHQATN